MFNRGRLDPLNFALRLLEEQKLDAMLPDEGEEFDKELERTRQKRLLHSMRYGREQKLEDFIDEESKEMSERLDTVRRTKVLVDRVEEMIERIDAIPLSEADEIEDEELFAEMLDVLHGVRSWAQEMGEVLVWHMMYVRPPENQMYPVTIASVFSKIGSLELQLSRRDGQIKVLLAREEERRAAQKERGENE
jgi:hypothetical protein